MLQKYGPDAGWGKVSGSRRPGGESNNRSRAKKDSGIVSGSQSRFLILSLGYYN